MLHDFSYLHLIKSQEEEIHVKKQYPFPFARISAVSNGFELYWNSDGCGSYTINCDGCHFCLPYSLTNEIVSDSRWCFRDWLHSCKCHVQDLGSCISRTAEFLNGIAQCWNVLAASTWFSTSWTPTSCFDYITCTIHSFTRYKISFLISGRHMHLLFLYNKNWLNISSFKEGICPFFF